MRRLLVAVLVLAFVSSLAACSRKDTAQADMNAKLDGLAAQGPNALRDYVDANAQDIKVSRYITPWLTAKVKGYDPQSLYSMILSDLLLNQTSFFAKQKQQKLAADTFVLAYNYLQMFEVMAMIDAARCTNEAAIDAIRDAMSARYAVYSKGGKINLPQEWQDTAKKNALAYEDVLADRKPNKAICDLAGKLSDKEIAERQANVKPDGTIDIESMANARMTQPASPGSEFISNEAWRERRSTLREQFEKRSF